MLKTSFNRSKQSWSIYCCKTCQDGKERDQPIHEIDPPKQYGKMTRLSQSRSAESNHINPITSSLVQSSAGDHRNELQSELQLRSHFFFKVVNRKKKGKGLEWGGFAESGQMESQHRGQYHSTTAAERRVAFGGRPMMNRRRRRRRNYAAATATRSCVCVCVCVCRIFVNSHDTADCRERKTGLQRCRTACISSGRLATWQG